MANSKKKGNKNEREVSKWFQEWTGFEFSRVPASGGLRWQKQDDINGDVICTDKRHGRRMTLSIEAKSYKDINFEHVILGNKRTKILEFWEQTQASAKRANKIPILFMRYNGMPKGIYFVVVRIDTYNIINNIRELLEPHFIDKVNNIVIMNSKSIKLTNYLTLHKSLKHASK